ncbi:MAG: methylenetetrahydrofolate reductase C-terminal domain-containing protein [Chloroflexi bacterium]|nr:methylenetetrahydrofolate reductase C-terminal domain-containing protein [Chloroflexota bacterium]
MITGEQKPLSEIREMIAGRDNLLIVGCGTCVTVCFAGGEREVGILASTLRLAERVAGREIEITERTVKRQCEWEFVDQIAEEIKGSGAVLSLACGIGVQTIAERFPDKIVLPGLNTSFLGMPVEQGVWREMCAACGNCVLALTGGICPVARCSKNLLNGPCGGSQNGRCEVSSEVPCAWQLVYDRLTTLDMLKNMEVIQPPKDWSAGYAPGPRRIVREDLKV